MAEHYTRAQTECEAWCGKCRRITLHRVDHPPAGAKGGGRCGPCIDPAHPVQVETVKQRERREQAEDEKRNPKLF